MNPKIVAALYKFVKLENYLDLCVPIQAQCDELGITGTLLLAEEGINGTIAGTRENIDAILAYLRSDVRLADLPHKESSAEGDPFYRMKVKIKKEIVTMGVPDIDPTELVGQYVKPEDWNALISDHDVLLVDTRNDYEVDVGTFQGAVNPRITTFREFPEYVKKHFDPEKQPRVAMFCTGGIRCEKASAYMLQQGFGEVYHLQGGILKYLENVSAKESLWEASVSCLTNVSQWVRVWRRDITNYATAVHVRSRLKKKLRQNIRRGFPVRIVTTVLRPKNARRRWSDKSRSR